MRRLALAAVLTLLLAGCGGENGQEPGGGGTGPTTSEQSGPYDY